MAYHTNLTVLAGNLGDDPDLRFLDDGTAVCRLRVAADNGKHDPTWLTVVAWRELGEHVAASLSKGDRVVVVGRINVRSYEQDGERRTVTEVEADEVSPSLRWATAKPSKPKPAEPQQAEPAVETVGAVDDVPF